MGGKRREVGWSDVAQRVNWPLSEKGEPPASHPSPDCPPHQGSTGPSPGPASGPSPGPVPPPAVQARHSLAKWVRGRVYGVD